MPKKINTDKLKSLLPYFVLALAIIISYRIIAELSFFIDILRQGWGILRPFFYGFIVAYIINVPCSGVQKLLARSSNKFIIKRQRILSVLIVFLILALVIYLTLDLIVPAIANSISFFIENIPVYWEAVVQFIDDINDLELFGLYISAEGIFSFLGDIFADFSFENLASPINAIMDAGAAVFTGFIAFISSIYILVEKDRIKKLVHKLLRIFAPKEFNNFVVEYGSKLNKNFRQYIHTQTIDGLILGTLATIQLFILGSPFALVLGIMLGIVNYVPYFGSIVGTIIAVLVVGLTQGFTMGAIVTVTLLITQQIDANIIQPRLMSGSFSLSPLLVIISISAGGAVAGILGMIAAIPIVAVLKDMFDGIVAYYEYKKFGNQGGSNERQGTDEQMQNEVESGDE